MNEPLQEWFNRQRESTPDDMYYKQASGQQIMFVRDRLAAVFMVGLPYAEFKDAVRVISTHTSKSVKLPVYSMSRDDIGLRVILRENFYNWKLSVISARSVECDFSGLFHTTPPIDPDYTGDYLHPVYFEGFPRDLIFGYYEPSDKRSWSAEIQSDEAMWMTLFLIMRSLGVVKPLRWGSRPAPEGATP